MMMMKGLVAVLALWIVSCTFVHCADPDAVLDFCVADTKIPSKVWQTPGAEAPTWEGLDSSQVGVAIPALNDTTDSIFPCKSAVTVSDFVFSGLGGKVVVNNKLGSVVTPANVMQFPGLNTLGISAARIDFAKWGLNAPHIHPRATELLRVLKGCLIVGFVDTNNTLFLTRLQVNDLFVFPKGTLHFQIEVGQDRALALAHLSSQNPGTLKAVDALFNAHPPIDPVVIEKALGIDVGVFLTLSHAVASLSAR